MMVHTTDERPTYKMRFVGYDMNNELKKGAPKFKKNEVRELPIEYSENPWWELIDAVPDLVLPELKKEDSVYVEEIYAPSDGQADASLEVEDSEPEESEEVPVVQPEVTADLPDLEEEVFVDPEVEEKLIRPVDVKDEDITVIIYEDMTVPSLKLFIEQRGGKVESKWLKPDLVRVARELEEALRAA